jgi:ABC-type spermidine/putrescine transport system permease subunit I
VARLFLLARPYELGLIGFTLIFGIEVAALSVALGFPVALWLRSLPGRWRYLALGLILLPKMASVLVAIFGLQRLLGSQGPINSLLVGLGCLSNPIPLNRNHWGALLGEVYQVVPLAIAVLSLRVFSIDPALEKAARGLGAHPFQVFQRVTMPLSMPGILVAMELSLLWGWGAFLGPLFLGSPEETSLAVAFFHESFELMAWPRGALYGLALVVLMGTGLGLFRLVVMWPGRSRWFLGSFGKGDRP